MKVFLPILNKYSIKNDMCGTLFLLARLIDNFQSEERFLRGVLALFPTYLKEIKIITLAASLLFCGLSENDPVFLAFGITTARLSA